MTLFKQLFVACGLFIAFSTSYAENGDNSNAFNKFMSPEGGVNPLSGTVALTKSLASISVGEVSVSFDLSYSGNIFKEMETRNDRTSVGLVGLGWTLGRAKVVSDNRGTSFIGDDQYYLMLPSGGRFQIFKDSSDKWWVEGNPFLMVERIIGSTDVTGKGDSITYVKGWKITDTKGVVHEYGDLNDLNSSILTAPERNATEYDLFWPLKDDGKTLGYGLIGKAISGKPWLYPVVWNVSKEIDVEGNILQYTYEQITEGLSGDFETSGPWKSGTMEYTKESYLTKVVSSMNDVLQFKYENKGEGEFFGEFLDYEGKKNELLGDTDVDMAIEKVNRKYLSKIEISGRDGRVGSVELCYLPLVQYAENGDKKAGFTKRLLSAIRFFNKAGVESDYEYYEYYGQESAVVTGNRAEYPSGALFRVKGKDCGWVEYTYVKETLGSGHVETLDAEKIFGKGYLDDGTPYLVGKKTDKKVVVFHRINGSWEHVKTIDVKDVSDVQLGDRGWFLIKDKLQADVVGALIYQWDGKDWNEEHKETIDNGREFWSWSSRAMNVFAGPDYVIRVETNGGTFESSVSTLDVVWSKWGESFTLDTINKAMVNGDGIKIMAQKKHILVQVNSTEIYNSVRFFVYTFDSKGGVQQTFEEYNQDNGSTYFLGEDYFVGVEEPSALLGRSRFRAWLWNGSDWVREFRDNFENLFTAVDLQAHGQDYYTVRHHAKEHLTNYYWDTERWSSPSEQRHLHIQEFSWPSAAWKWAGFSGRDFFVVGQSRLKCKWWGCDVKKYVYLQLYFMKDAENKNWSYKYIGAKGDKMNQKDVITGEDWFIEKNQVFLAWIWDGEKWVEEPLNNIPDLEKAYSLGENAFAVPAKNKKTNVYYKVGNSFTGSYDSYHVKTKTIFDPVVDKTIEYNYDFTKNKAQIAYDEANNTPLFKEMNVILPFGQGEVHSVLCDGKYPESAEYNVGLGSSCIESQRGRSNSAGNNHTALLSRKQTFFERHRESGWPASVYQDRVKKVVSFNGTTKETITYEYSSKNGQVVSTKKKTGSKTTEKVTKYVVDLNSPISDYDAKLGKANRVDAIAGGYSCIGECSKGRIVAAYANGWDTVDNVFRSVSTWNMVPKKRMLKSDVEQDISSIVQNGAVSSYVNWKRSSYNSVYNKGDVIETEEGPKKIKMASFKNPLTRRVYGTAAGCGVNECLMLSGEYCDVINDVVWSGCVPTGEMDGITGYAIHGNSGSQYGRFSTKMLKLSSAGAISATIKNPQLKKYRISAWVQTLDNDSVKVQVTLGTDVLEKNVKTNKGWQKVDFETSAMQSNGAVQFSLTTTAPSGIRVQDIRVLPYDATSSALFWDDMWDKVITTVNDRGVGSYVVYDALGRGTESYSETAEGNVYLASRQTFVDGSCVITASGSDKLDYVKVNGKTYKNPSSKRNFALDAIDVSVSLGLDSANDSEIRYALVKGGESDWKNKNLPEWIPAACGGLCPISFKFTDNPEWTLFVDVAPFDSAKSSKGDYAFQFGMKKKDWVVYGQIEGFVDGEMPQYANPYDSSNVVYKNDRNDSLYKAMFKQSLWKEDTSAIVAVRSIAYNVAYGKNNGYSLSLIPLASDAGKSGDDSTITLAYPRIYGSDNGINYIYRDLKDTTFSVDDVKTVVNGNASALIFRADIREKIVSVTGRDSTVTGLVTDSLLYSKIWNKQSNRWENLGSIPVFDRDTLSVSISGRDTVLKVVHGNIVSYLDGVVCDYNNDAFDMVSGPEGKLYVAYIGTPKNFAVNTKVVEDDGVENNVKIAPAYIVVKRLYNASETSMGRSVWAGPSKISGQPRYEGDIVSWDGSNLHAIEEAKSVKLAYDGKSLFMAVVYKTHADERFNDDEKAVDESASANVDYGELALTVFKASLEQNVNADGVTYSTYLRWTPVKDNSILVAKSGNSLADERNRVIYMQPGDAFDLKVRGDIPYILFRNKANANKISVITHDGDRWLSIGNPAFAYPVQTGKSADLAISVNDSIVHPYVVFEQGFAEGYATRKDRLVAMRYNADDKIDLSISSLDLGADSLNESCAFRQYILNYALNVGYEDSLSIKPTLRTSADVARIDIYVNDNFVLNRTVGSKAYSVVGLNPGLNRIELRVVGKDSSELSYYLNTIRKPLPNPVIWAAGNSFVVNGFMVDSIAKIDLTKLIPNPSELTKLSVKDTTKIHIHVKGGWKIHVGDSPIPSDTVLFGGDTLRFLGGYIPKNVIAVSPEDDTVIVDLFVKNDSLSLFWSSSSVNQSSSSSSNPWLSYLSDGDDDDDIYQGDLSSSSGIGGYSSSCEGDACWSVSSSSCYGGSCSTSSSSSSLNGGSYRDSLTHNVPDGVKDIAYAKFLITGNLRVGNRVSVAGTIAAGGRVEVGVETYALEGTISGDDIFLANRSQVDGLRLIGNLHVQDGAVYGSVINEPNLAMPTMPSFSFATGSSDIIVEPGQNGNVSPGAYRNFAAREKSKIHFAAGDYYFDSFWTDPYVDLEFESGTRVWIANGLNVANFSRVTHTGDTGDLFVYVGSSGFVSIGNNVQMKAVLYAPQASVQVYDHTVFEGFVWSANFNVEPFCELK